MKIISLNIGFGEHLDALLEFLVEQSKTTDIFCFQELLTGTQAEFSTQNHARLNILNEVANRLKDFDYKIYLAPENARHIRFELLPVNVNACLGIFYKKGVKLIDNGGFRTYQPPVEGMNFGAMITGNCQWLSFKDKGKELITLLNLWGIYQRDIDTDSQARIKQSQMILDFIKSRKGEHFVIGDFNLPHNCKSIDLLSNDLRNLIEEFNITDTRGKLYTNKPDKYSDYAFISAGIKLENFSVLDVAVSDHLPLCLTIN